MSLPQSFNMEVLEQAAATFYSNSRELLPAATKILDEFQQSPDAWKHVDTILNNTRSSYTRLVALQALELTVKRRWDTLDSDSKQEIRKLVIKLFLHFGRGSVDMKAFKLEQGKVTSILGQILKQDFPQHWPAVIPDLIEVARSNDAICGQVLDVFLQLGEEVLDLIKSPAKIRSISGLLEPQFRLMSQFLEYILFSTHASAELRLQALQCLTQLIPWMPPSAFTDTDLVGRLMSGYFVAPSSHPFSSRNGFLKFLNAAVESRISVDRSLVEIVQTIIRQLSGQLPADSDLNSFYENGTVDVQELIQSIQLLFTSLIQSIPIDSVTVSTVTEVVTFMLRLSLIQDEELWQAGVLFWHTMVLKLVQAGPASELTRYFIPALNPLMRTLIQRLTRPEDFPLIENDDYEPIRPSDSKVGDQVVKDHEVASLVSRFSEQETHSSLCSVLAETVSAFLNIVQSRDEDSRVALRRRICSLCWSAALVYRTISDETMRLQGGSLVVSSMNRLIQASHTKSDKVFFRASLLYTVCHNVSFLKSDWSILKRLVIELFEIMRSNQVLAEIASNSFLQVCQHASADLACLRQGESTPLISELITNLSGIVSTVEADLHPVLYQAVATVIDAIRDDPPRAERYLQQLLTHPLQRFLVAVGSDVQAAEVSKELTRVLKIFVALCSVLGSLSIWIIQQLSGQISSLFQVISQKLEALTSADNSTKDLNKLFAFRSIRQVKKQILKLLISPLPATAGSALNDLLPFIISTVMEDYRKMPLECKDVETLTLVDSVLIWIPENAETQLSILVDSVLESSRALLSLSLQHTVDANKDIVRYAPRLLDVLRTLCTRFSKYITNQPVIFSTVLECLLAVINANQLATFAASLGTLTLLLTSATDCPTVGDICKAFGPSILQCLLTSMAIVSSVKSASVLAESIHSLLFLYSKVEQPLQPPHPNASIVGAMVLELLTASFPFVRAEDLRRFSEPYLTAVWANDRALSQRYLLTFLSDCSEVFDSSAWQ